MISSRETLLSQIAGLFEAPLSQTASLLEALLRDTVGLVNALVDKRVGEGEAPAPAAEPAAQRQPFAALRALLDQLRQSGLQVDTLSMGMSADMDAAIAEGATLVRIGTDRKSTRLNSSHIPLSRMPSSA